ncbi:MAG: hypothetical protein ACI837_001518, partial [Crocinitomicaceae bacterium]
VHGSSYMFVYDRKTFGIEAISSISKFNERLTSRLGIGEHEVLIGFSNRVVKINIDEDTLMMNEEVSSAPIAITNYRGTFMVACRNGNIFKVEGTKLVKQIFIEAKMDSRIFDIEIVDDVLIIAGNNGIKKYRYNKWSDKWSRISFFSLQDARKIYMYNGSLYYMTKKEIFQDLNIEKDPIIPLVTINQIKINDSVVVSNSGVNLVYSQNNIEFNLVSISYGAKFLQYRYKLKGSDGAYRFTEDNKITYSSLPPGDYEFMVSSTTNGVDYSKEQIFSFSITSPFWKTAWFTAGIIILLMALAFLFYRNQLKKYKAKHLLKQTIDELKSKALAAQLNPHLIFNILNSIQASISEEETEKANLYLARFANFMRITLNFSKRFTVPLQDELELTHKYIELELLRFPVDLKIQIHEDDSPSKFLVPPLILQPYIENAIKHGIMKVKGLKGEINIYIKELDESLTIKISNNGDIGNGEFVEGDGMRISKERLQILNKRNMVSIKQEMNQTIIELELYK